MKHPLTELAEKILIAMSHGGYNMQNYELEKLTDKAWKLATELYEQETERVEKYKRKEPDI